MNGQAMIQGENPMIKDSSNRPAVEQTQMTVKAYDIDHKNETVASTKEARWVRAATPAAPRWL